MKVIIWWTVQVRKLKPINQHGDTIVEVLIAIAVASAVLAITYGIMNRNLAIMRANQERTEATKLAQAEVESLKTYIENNRAAITAKGNELFCINLTSNTIASLTGTPPADSNLDGYTVYANCTSTLYYYYINRDTTDITLNSYYVTIRWPTFNGGHSQMQLKYRVP